MIATFDTVLQDALRLSLEDRSRIATRLIASVDADDFELSPAWKAKIETRMKAIKDRTTKLIPHDEAMHTSK
jgi:putative addiction module component (TIGR02574 family)